MLVYKSYNNSSTEVEQIKIRNRGKANENANQIKLQGVAAASKYGRRPRLEKHKETRSE